MKKIFTLVFSVGLLTSAFAQTDNRHQNPQNNTTRYQQSQYQGGNQYQAGNQYTSDNRNGYTKSYGNNDGFNKTAQWNQPVKQQYGHQDRDVQKRDERMHGDQSHFPVQ